MERLRTVSRLSYSQMTTYLRCPRLWYERYILKHRLEEKPQPLCFGIAFHRGMEHLMKNWGNADVVVEIHNAVSTFEYEYSLGKNRGPDVDKWLPIGARMIRNTYKLIRNRGVVPLPGGVEKRCKRPGFQGYVDCLATVKGRRTIIDWKTAARPYKKRDVEDNMQLTAYGWMLPGQWDSLAFCVAMKHSSMVYWYSTTRTPRQIEEFAQLVEDIRYEMETTEQFLGKHTKKACMAYRHKCDMWEGGWCRGLDSF